MTAADSLREASGRMEKAEQAEQLLGIALAWVVGTGGVLFMLHPERLRGKAEERRAFWRSLLGRSPSVEQLERRFRITFLVMIILGTVAALVGAVFVVAADPSQLKQPSP